MKKFIINAILVMIIAISFAIPAFASNQTNSANITYCGISIVIDDNTLTPQDVNGNTVEPFAISGTTYLPLRAVASAMGLNVEWNGTTHTINLSTGGTVNYGSGTPTFSNTTKKVPVTYCDIKLVINGNSVIPKDVKGNIVEPFAIDGTTYLPIRAIATALGADVSWDGDTNTVYIYSNSNNNQSSQKYLVKTAKDTYTSSTTTSTSVTTYTYDMYNRKIDVKTVGEGGYISENKYTYDVWGNLVTESFSLKLDEYNSPWVKSTDYTYDENNNCISEQEYSNGESSWGYNYTYDEFDSTGRPLKKTVYAKKSWVEVENGSYTYTDVPKEEGYYSYTYDDLGNCLSKLYYSASNPGYAKSSDYYTYDDRGNMLTHTISGTVNKKYVYTYDDNNNMLTKYEWSDSNIFSSGYNQTTYEYDSHNNVVKETYFTSTDDGSSTSGYTINYTNSYDSNGNLVKKTYNSTTETDGTHTVIYEYTLAK